MRLDELGEPGVGDPPRAEAVHRDGGRAGHANGVGHLDLAALGEARRHQILGDVARGVGGRAVDLARVLAREGAAAVAAHAAVGVHDDLAPRDPGVAERAADDEAPGRVDVVAGVPREPLGGQHGLHDLLHHRLAQGGDPHVRPVLGREHHRLDRHRPVVLVAEGHLALGVRTQPRQAPRLAHLGLAGDQPVGVGDRGRHQDVGLAGRVAEHQPLVTGALLVLGGLVDAHGDVARLLADGGQHRAGLPVEAHVRAGVADLPDRLAHELVVVDRGVARDLAGEHHHAGLDQGLAGHAGPAILGQVGIQNGVRNLVGDLVRVPLRDRLGGEEEAVRHGGGSSPRCRWMV